MSISLSNRQLNAWHQANTIIKPLGDCQLLLQNQHHRLREPANHRWRCQLWHSAVEPTQTYKDISYDILLQSQLKPTEISAMTFCCRANSNLQRYQLWHSAAEPTQTYRDISYDILLQSQLKPTEISAMTFCCRANSNLQRYQLWHSAVEPTQTYKDVSYDILL